MNRTRKTSIRLAAAASFTVFALTLHAQKLTASKVPDAVKIAFAKKYPEVDKVTWEKEGAQFEAGFKDNDQIMSALFTTEGILTEWEVGIPIKTLPAAALTYIKEHYGNVTIKEAAKITKASGEINYEAEIKGKDVLFDADGKHRPQ